MPFTGQKTPDVVLEDGRIQPGMRVYVPPTVKPPTFLRADAVLKRFRWTLDMLKEAQAMGFPPAAAHKDEPTSDGGVTRQWFYREDLVEAWVANVRRLVKHL